MAKWLREAGPEKDIVMSSRVRVARNLADTPFPQLLDEAGGKAVMKQLYESVIGGNAGLKEDFTLLQMRDLSPIQRKLYVEKHLISPDLAKRTAIGAALINREETISILINEEDHIRIQCLLPGLQLEEAWDLADKVDDLIEERVTYAYHDQLGYLTSCPTNLGTGIRASVMMHLPALKITNYINGIFQASSQLKIAIRGIYGEGTEALGNIFQISNQATLGASEEDIIRTLKEVSLQIIQQERMLRERLLNGNRIELENRIFRAYGILTNARMISGNEAMTLISDVKLGVSLGMLHHVTLERLNQLTSMIQPGYLQQHYGENLNEVERDIKRAELIRNKLLS